jgi:pantoate--beta-alanine ligase
MITVSRVADLREAVARARAAGRGRVGLVPTMGALHEGHRSLLDVVRGAGRADFAVVSVFVNPTQFGPNEDFSAYPRTPDADAALVAGAGADVLWMPEAADLYPPGAQTFVEVTEVTKGLCGARRPGHFRGVATVVAKLFAAAQPDVAVFGEKDFQQLQTLRRMKQDLLLPVEIVGAPTVREPDGLALSSRNRYLDAGDRVRALGLSHALRALQAHRAAGETRVAALLEAGRAVLAEAGVDRVDYLEVVDAETLVPLDAVGPAAAPARALVAAFVGRARLIDNMPL